MAPSLQQDGDLDSAKLEELLAIESEQLPPAIAMDQFGAIGAIALQDTLPTMLGFSEEQQGMITLYTDMTITLYTVYIYLNYTK